MFKIKLIKNPWDNEQYFKFEVNGNVLGFAETKSFYKQNEEELASALQKMINACLDVYLSDYQYSMGHVNIDCKY